MMDFVQWADEKTAPLRARFALLISGACLTWAMLGFMTVSVPAQSTKYEYNAVEVEQRFTRLETQMSALLASQESGHYANYGIMTLLSALVGETAIRVAKGKKESKEE